jgi:hypothetical protein
VGRGEDSNSGLTLARQALYDLSHASALFALVNFRTGSLVFAQGESQSEVHLLLSSV